MVYCRKATAQDMRAVAELHEKCFSDYFLTSLGIDLIEKYYREFQMESNIFVLAFDDEAEDGHKLVGFLMGYYRDTCARSNFESKYKWKLFRRLLKLCLCFNKDAISRCFDKVKSIFWQGSKEKDEFIPDADFLSIAILPEYRTTKGISGMLITECERIMLAREDLKVKSCTVSTKIDNIACQRCFEKRGWTRLSEKKGAVRYVQYYPQ